MEVQLPNGYKMVPETDITVPRDVYYRYFKKAEWENIEHPTFKDIADYLGVSADKVKRDFKNVNCPLRVFQKGGKGRGNDTKFYKFSAEEYIKTQK